MSRIAPHFYQGSAPQSGTEVRECGFDVLVLCAQEYQPPEHFFPGVTVIHCPLDDSGKPMSQTEWEVANYVAERVAKAARAGKRVLVTCMQGRNRSGLVTALVLHRLTGRSGRECIRHVRVSRAGALQNDYFVAALSKLNAVRGVAPVEAWR